MSKQKKQRAYALNVAQQFLQSFLEPKLYSPLYNVGVFDQVCCCDRSCESVNNFYCHYHSFIRNFLVFFTSEKLGCLVSAGLAKCQEKSSPQKTSLITTFGDHLVWWDNGSGDDMLLGFAVISVAAAAYDLCHTKHYQGGIRPL